MDTYISFLRGINVSGHRLVRMDALRQLVESLGFTGVQTYIQSGNVVFNGSETSVQAVEEKMAEAIAATFGFEVPVLAREREELRQIVAHNPFARDATKQVAHLHATFLSGTPDPQRVQEMATGNSSADECRLVGGTLYLHCPDGYGRSKWNNSFLEKKLGMTATTRNWKTVCQLLSLADEARPW